MGFLEIYELSDILRLQNRHFDTGLYLQINRSLLKKPSHYRASSLQVY